MCQILFAEAAFLDLECASSLAPQLAGELKELWLKSGAFKVMVFQLEYVTAYCMLATVDVAWLVTIVCQAEQTDALQTRCPGVALLAGLPYQPFVVRAIAAQHPRLREQASQVWRQATSADRLLPTLRKYWLALPNLGRHPAAVDEGFRQGHCIWVSSLMMTGFREALAAGEALVEAWSTLIADKLDSYAPIMRICLPDNRPQGAECLAGLFQMVAEPCSPSILDALDRCYGPDQPRCPELLTAFWEVVMHTASWLPDPQEPPPNVVSLSGKQVESASGMQPILLYYAVSSLYGLMHKASITMPKPGANAFGKLMRNMFYAPTLKFLMHQQAPSRFMEALARSTARWDGIFAKYEIDKDAISPLAGKLFACMAGQLDSTTSPAAILSLLATLRKVVLVSGDSGFGGLFIAPLARFSILALCPLLPWFSSAPKTQLDRSSDARRQSQPGWYDVNHYTSTWLLPMVLDKLSKARGTELILPCIGEALRVVHRLAATAQLTDAVAPPIVTACAGLLDNMTSQAALDTGEVQRYVASMPEIINAVVGVQPSRARLCAVVQSGLLARLCQLACSWWADEGRRQLFEELSKALLPTVATLLPHGTTGHHLRAVAQPFQAARTNNRNELHDQACKSMVALHLAIFAFNCGPLPYVERARMAALGPGCHNPACQNLQGVCEAELRTKKCSGCNKARYCSAACQKTAWKLHKHVCKTLAKHSGA
ncbi:hypothetical protein WJX72_002074 [[Myrmecia] bisecta]|uniref:MYND-type domain-containing protein n=1 Tax=[Myrmecia] bisecta TaxID=41462 RepID=A0AAW1Q4U4_9CHLO